MLGDLLDVDLRNLKVSVGLLRPPVVAARRTVSEMADAQQAVAGVNGDFLNIKTTHPGVAATGSSSGAEVVEGRPLRGRCRTGSGSGLRCHRGRRVRASSVSGSTGAGTSHGFA